MEGEERCVQGERWEPIGVEGGDTGHVVEALGRTGDFLGREGKEEGQESVEKT